MIIFGTCSIPLTNNNTITCILKLIFFFKLSINPQNVQRLLLKEMYAPLILSLVIQDLTPVLHVVYCAVDMSSIFYNLLLVRVV